MNDNDATEYYNAIVEILNQNNAGWVVQQVTEEVRFGKITSGEFSITKVDSFNDPYQTSLFERRGDYRISKKEKLNQILPFTSQEKLLVLIRAIRRLVVDTSDIRKHLASFVETEISKKNTNSDIRFYSEEASEDTISLTESKSQIDNDAIVKLKDLLSKLESEAANGD